ncbi:MAG: apocarotenoid5,15-oxygenase [Ilumatobacteraceae bacterium]|nr:apocarotenoid5,15-oxygenase [Ilumatobacteraceae bacterium]
MASTLDPEDDHPYRTGAWQPNFVEYDADDLEIEGTIPADLAGVYLRNTENPVHQSIGRYHPFDGDGMVHAMSFADGRATYRNRFVRTAGLTAENEAGHALWAGLAESPERSLRTDGWGARTRMKDASSTDIVVHAGVAKSSFYQCGDLYRLDPSTLTDLGRESWDGRFPTEGVSAHTKVDDRTGEMLFFNYSTTAPYMHYGVVDASNTLVHYTPVPLPGPRLPHDMAFTEHYAILNDCPMFWDPKLLDRDIYAVRYFRDLPTRFAVIPRRGWADDIRWFEADPTYVLHWINAYEDGDEIVLDGFQQAQPNPKPTPDATLYEQMFRFVDLAQLQAHPHRWRFNMRTGACTEERLDDRILEFGMINNAVAGQPYRHAYAVSAKPGWFLFDGLHKLDVRSGAVESYQLPDGVFASEAPFAPRLGATAEDDGYLLTFTTDMNTDASHCLIFSAQDLAGGPIARVRLPERISSGTHSCWAPASAL